MEDLPKWRPEYSVGHATLDSQHKRLLELCDKVSSFKCDRSKASLDSFHLILNDLACYATTHFETEEQVLRHVGYPKLQEQKKDHDEYGDKLVEFLFSAMSGETDKSSLLDFLHKWWLNHILHSDMEYSDYLKQHSR